LHRLFAQVWRELLGFGLKSAIFLEASLGRGEA
jgi:hypothetical protein